jgi:phosphoribosylformylglycinamidine synthase
MEIRQYYRRPGLTPGGAQALAERLGAMGLKTSDLDSEICYNVGLASPLSEAETRVIVWLLAETFEPGNFSERPFLPGPGVIEVGPRLSFASAWSTNAVSICRAVGLKKVLRLELSRRYLVRTASGALSPDERASVLALVHDRMTEMPYPGPLRSFEHGLLSEPVLVVPVIEEGRAALERLNRELGLGFDAWDMDFYYDLFARRIGRNPTDVECFDLAQSNSEHSRHWFFKGRIVIDGVEQPRNLMEVVSEPWRRNPGNSVIAFHDNSSAIMGSRVRTLVPSEPGGPSPFVEDERTLHVLLTAETHNFPSGVAPFPGAETGTGGRIRDVQAAGRGGHVVAGTAAYCVGNLRVPGYDLPWEDPSFAYPGNLASPLRIEVEASNGASDYGNKFGEPLVQGFTRSFGLRLPSGERREWLKPIMFTGGVGSIDARHTGKGAPAPGMVITKIGGPAYRIGMGGGAASSMVQGENVEELDFNAVQRGDAEMEQKLNRVIRACIELGDRNPIVSIHDQGAGGNCNVLKEIIAPAGGRIDIRKVPLGDTSLSVLEIWGAEYQENNALLLRAEHAELFAELCAREKVPCAFLGEVTGDGRVEVVDSEDGSTPVDLALADVLGEMPRKTFAGERPAPRLQPLALPPGTDVRAALDRVLRLVSVGSKRFLASKVDRSVTGLVARQQCAGPLHLTVADVAVVARSHFSVEGAAISIGEQPIKGLLSPAAMARMAVAEALTNIVWALATDLGDVRASANWMWAAKLPGEGALLYDAALAMADFMAALGIAVDGGKDSLSMAALVPDAGGAGEPGEIVKCPGALVVSAYVTTPDITKTVTPDIKRPGESILLYLDLSGGRARTGGSALAQCYGQVGSECPDMEDPALLARAFRAVQGFIARELVLSGHDRSDGGLIVTLLEMAFAGNCGLDIDLPGGGDPIAVLFAEEAGLVIECGLADEGAVRAALDAAHVPHTVIGRTRAGDEIHVSVGGEPVLNECMRTLRDIWEETSYRLERLQRTPALADEEKRNIYTRNAPPFALGFTPEPTGVVRVRPRIGIVREEGSNGDREMTAAFHAAGFECWDLAMSDLLAGRATLDQFRGLAFVGGFSYADVLDSAKGWAGTIRYNERLREGFARFAARPDTFSLGVCNGCQLMALLGWVPGGGLPDTRQPRFVHNASGRFESRFSTVRIEPGPAIMLRGMEGSVLGVWVAHGEGRALFPDASVLEGVLAGGLAPVRYADDAGLATEAYPFNPNGSPLGIAALCSPDGRHLAIMPHPERAFLTWQWPWMPEDWRRELRASPWLRLFQNARTWCGGE